MEKRGGDKMYVKFETRANTDKRGLMGQNTQIVHSFGSWPTYQLELFIRNPIKSCWKCGTF